MRPPPCHPCVQAAEKGGTLASVAAAAAGGGSSSSGPAGSAAAVSSANIRRGVALLKQEKVEAYQTFKQQLQVHYVLWSLKQCVAAAAGG